MAEKDKIMEIKNMAYWKAKNGVTPLKTTKENSEGNKEDNKKFTSTTYEKFKKDFPEKAKWASKHKPKREILQDTDRQKMEDMRRMAGANPIASIGAGVASIFGMDKFGGDKKKKI